MVGRPAGPLLALARLRAHRRPPSTDPLRGPSSDGAPGAVPTESLRQSGPGRDLGSVRSVQHPGQRPGRSPSWAPPWRVGQRLTPSGGRSASRPGGTQQDRCGSPFRPASSARRERLRPSTGGSVSVLRGRADVSRRVAEGLLGDQSAWRWSLGGRSLSERRWHGRQVVLPEAPLLPVTPSSFPRGPASRRRRGGGRGSGPSWEGRGGSAEACVQAHRRRRRPGPAWPRLGLLTPAAAAGAAAGSARLPPSRLPLLCSAWVAFVCTLRCDKSLLSSPVYLS